MKKLPEKIGLFVADERQSAYEYSLLMLWQKKCQEASLLMAKSTFLWRTMNISFNENTLIKLLYENTNHFGFLSGKQSTDEQQQLYPERCKTLADDCDESKKWIIFLESYAFEQISFYLIQHESPPFSQNSLLIAFIEFFLQLAYLLYPNFICSTNKWRGNWTITREPVGDQISSHQLTRFCLLQTHTHARPQIQQNECLCVLMLTRARSQSQTHWNLCSTWSQ